MGSSGNRTRSIRPGGNSNRNLRSNGTHPSFQVNYFVCENHELVIWKKRMFFGSASSEVLTAIFWEARAILHLILDLMRQWIFKCLASEKFVLATGSNLSLATGLASWKVSLEPCRLIIRPCVNTGKQRAGRGGGYLTKFCTRRLCPEVQPLTLSYHFGRKGTPFIYLLLKKGSPFTYLF